jgi:RNA polymerase sigma-70 factor (ECF subfamily)
MKRDMDNSSKGKNLFISLTLSSQKDIYVYILRLIMSASDADDILQDTLSVMWNKFEEFQSGTDFIAWGKQIAKYKVMDFIRKNKSSKLSFDSDILKIIEDTVNQKDEMLDCKDSLKECLRKLSEKSITMLKMRYVDDLSYKAIAVKYGISKQSLYRSISRIHAILLKCIKHLPTNRGFYGS